MIRPQCSKCANRLSQLYAVRVEKLLCEECLLLQMDHVEVRPSQRRTRTVDTQCEDAPSGSRLEILTLSPVNIYPPLRHLQVSQQLQLSIAPEPPVPDSFPSFSSVLLASGVSWSSISVEIPDVQSSLANAICCKEQNDGLQFRVDSPVDFTVIVDSSALGDPRELRPQKDILSPQHQATAMPRYDAANVAKPDRNPAIPEEQDHAAITELIREAAAPSKTSKEPTASAALNRRPATSVDSEPAISTETSRGTSANLRSSVVIPEPPKPTVFPPGVTTAPRGSQFPSLPPLAIPGEVRLEPGKPATPLSTSTAASEVRTPDPLPAICSSQVPPQRFRSAVSTRPLSSRQATVEPMQCTVTSEIPAETKAAVPPPVQSNSKSPEAYQQLPSAALASGDSSPTVSKSYSELISDTQFPPTEAQEHADIETCEPASEQSREATEVASHISLPSGPKWVEFREQSVRVIGCLGTVLELEGAWAGISPGASWCWVDDYRVLAISQRRTVLLNLRAKTDQELSNLPCERTAPGLCFSHGKCYLFGGELNGKVTRTGESLELGHPWFELPTQMRLARRSFHPVCSPVLIYLLGGLEPQQVETFDPRRQEFGYTSYKVAIPATAIAVWSGDYMYIFQQGVMVQTNLRGVTITKPFPEKVCPAAAPQAERGVAYILSTSGRIVQVNLNA